MRTYPDQQKMYQQKKAQKTSKINASSIQRFFYPCILKLLPKKKRNANKLNGHKHVK